MPEIEISKELLNFLIFLPVFFLSLAAHEFAHAIAASKLGDDTAKNLGRATLNPIKHIDLFGSIIMPVLSFASGLLLIGWAKPVPINRNKFLHKRRDDIIVTAAGPISNLILALIVSIAAAFINEPAAQSPFYSIMLYAVFLNVFLCLFNLLPIPPLDGSHILMNLVPNPSLKKLLSNGLIGSFILLLFVMSPLWRLFFRFVNLVVQQFILIFNL